MREKNTQAIHCGIDVSKKMLDVCLGDKLFRVNNTKGGINNLIKRLKRQPVALVVVESTGGYEKALLHALWEEGIPLSHVNPKQTRAFAQAQGLQAKSDKIDARTLKLFGQKMTPQLTPAPEPKKLELQALFDRRQQLKELITIEKNHLKAPLLCKQRKASIERVIKVLTRELKDIEKQASQLIKEDKELHAISQLLQKEKGVGKALTLAIQADLPELGRVSREKIASLVGVAPYINQSGQKDGKRFIRGGRKQVRTVLYMACVSAVRSNPYIKSYYLRLVKAGKQKMVALIASMRRFLCMLNAILKDYYLQQTTVTA